MGKTEQPKTNTLGDSLGSESRVTPTFTHLHLHTEYSLLDGGNQVDKLVDRIAELGMTSCAITDHGNMFGAAVFYQACKEKGIKPILGVEAYVTPPGKPRQDRTYSGGGEGGYHLVLLAMNNVGWQNLLVLCSEAYLTGFYYKPRIDRELLAKHSEGLIAINGHLGSEIGEHLLAFERTGDDKYWNLAKESAEWHKKAFGIRDSAFVSNSSTNAESRITNADSSPSIPRFYVELQHHVPEQNAINKWLIKLARELDVPLVCDNDAHFLREDDYNTHDTLICISTGKGKQDNNRMRYPREVFVKSPAEMAELFAGEEYNSGAYKNAGLEALANTQRIAEACNVSLALGANHAPMVRVVLPKPKDLPKHDDPKYAGDLTAWYADYCSKFELKPFRNEDGSEITDADKAKAKADCDAALRLLAEGGFIWRYGRAPTAESKTPNAGAQDDHAAKVARLERELKILADKNISAYFLIVWDFVNWGRSNGVPALARGSGVGTMVGYVLGLSNACPVRYGLLFERFTDPDRSEYPDIDIDLCQDGRGRVIDYVRRKYGHVAQIITFGTLKARAAIKDVGRVLEIPLAEVDRISKLVPEQLGITIEEAIKKEPELAGLYNKDLRIKDLLDQAIALEGHTRHAGVHAAGVIVATRPLHEIVPLYKQTAKEKDNGSGEVDAVITQWDGPTCEKMGLLKMDFLGLRTISVVARAKKLIRETMSEREIWEAVGRGEEYEASERANEQANEGKTARSGSSPRSLVRSFAHPLDLDRLSFADQRVFEIFRRGETTGVFQFESGGMRRLLVEMKPDRLEDLIAANALFRPGPMDLIPDYNRRKHGTEDVPKVHKIVDEYTRETYGVMVYQEQVMQIVHGLGGIKLRDAYSLIKNISKKKHDKIEKERPKFIEGAVKQGLTKDGANDLFELILKFAGYGFNKSHSTGYAIVAYQTAYLKCFYPAQYMAAFLTYESQANKASDWIPYLEDCRRTRIIDARQVDGRGGPEERNPTTIATGIEVKPPDINLSRADFAVVGTPALGTPPVRGGNGVAADVKKSDAVASSPGLESRGTQGTHIRFGLKAIKGIGEKAIDSIIAEREKSGPFTSLFEFCERVPPGAITKAMLESLIKCGAFDGVHGRENRAAMVGTIDAAITAGQRLAQDKAAGQSGLFGGGEDKSKGAQSPGKAAASTQAPLARVTAWAEKDLLTYEKDVLGFYVSSHPLERWKYWFDAFASANTARLKELQQDARVVLPCMIQSVRPIVVRNGKSAGQKMAILTVEDHTGAADCVLFTDNFTKYGHLAEADKVVYVLGRLDLSRGDPQVVVDRLVPIEGVPYDNGKVRLFLDEVRLNGEAANTLNRVAALLRAQDVAAVPDPKAKPAAQVESKATEAILKNAQAGIRFPVEVIIGTESSVAIIAADPRLRVELKPDFIKAMETELGAGMVKVVGGFTVEKDKKPWENGGKRKFSRDEE